jgi:ribonuclease Y
MASELGLDPIPAKRAGLLHDIGKAIDHEVDGPHAVIGADLARRYGEKPEIVHAIEAHHNDVEPNRPRRARPGCRRHFRRTPGCAQGDARAYIKRLEKLEEIANAHEGVERTYAMQAGRELRVMVEPRSRRRSRLYGSGARHREADRGRDDVSRPGQGRGHPRVPRRGLREVANGRRIAA